MSREHGEVGTVWGLVAVHPEKGKSTEKGVANPAAGR